MSFWSNLGTNLGNLGNTASQWAPVVGGLLSAYGGYQAARNQNEAAEAAGQPQAINQGGWNMPLPGSLPYLQEALGAARGVYLGSQGAPPMPGGGRRPGANQGMRDAANAMSSMAMGPGSYIQQAQGQALGLGAAPNYMMAGAYSGAASGTNGYLDQYINQGFGGGFDSSSPYLHQFIQGGMGGGETWSGSPSPGNQGGASIYSYRDPQASWTGRPTSGGYGGGGLGGLVSSGLADVINGDYLQAGNPHMQGMLDQVRSEADATWAARQAALDAQADAPGRYGSSMYQDMMARGYADHQESVANQQNSLLFNNYEAERGRMMDALGLASSHHGQQQSLALQGRSLAQANSHYQQGLDLQRQGLTLDAINSLSANDRAGYGMLGSAIGQSVANDQFRLGMMGDLGMAYGQQQLGALGLAPGLNQAGYYGLGMAFDAHSGIAGMDAQAAAANSANAWRGWQAQQNQPWANLNNYLGAIQSIAGMGGYSSSQQTTPGQYVPQVDPTMAAVSGGLSGYFGMQGAFGGGN